MGGLVIGVFSNGTLGVGIFSVGMFSDETFCM